MKAVFSPGPSYFNPEVRKYAGWTGIFDLMLEAVKELGFEAFIPQVDPSLIDNTCTVSKITTWDLVAAAQLPDDVDLFLGPPGYSLAQILKIRSTSFIVEDRELPPSIVGQPIRLLDAKIILWVWNNADWFRDQQLAPEYAQCGMPYDQSRAWRWINRTALQSSDRVVACSPFVKATHAQIVPEDKISIAFWGIDSSKFTPDWEWQIKNPTPLKILFVGSDPIRKGLSYLLDTLRGLEGIELTIAGCQFQEKIVEDFKRWGWTVLGMVPHNQMPGIMRHHHVICIPTLEDGIACSIQEGMASGLVPIATPDPAEVFTDGISGFKVPYRDIEALRKVIIELRDNIGSRWAIAGAARKQAEEQTWDKFKEEFKDIIQKECEK